MNNKKGFSIVEIIITISIIILLGLIGYNSKKGYDENVTNTKVISDTKTIYSALQDYIQENDDLPMPGGNTNFFSIDTSYVHSYEDTDTFGVYGSLTEKTLPKKYLDVLPLDPRTNSYYSYGKTKDTLQFEVASIQIKDSVPVAKVIGNYTAENGPYNLVREYNGPNFVNDGSEINLPYNPDELIMIATDIDGKIYREGDTITVPAGQKMELYFSDGSVSVLGDNLKETVLTLNQLNFKGGNNLNTVIKLALDAGKIWTKATKLNADSQFEVYTSDSSAAVRGTVFGVIKDTINTQMILIEGEIDILDKETKDDSIIYDTGTIDSSTVNNGTPSSITTTSINDTIYRGSNIIEKVKVKKGEKARKLILKKYSDTYTQKVVEESSDNTVPIFNSGEITLPEFSLNTSIRTQETEEKVLEESNPEPLETPEICNSFYIGTECMDTVADTGLTASGYTLYAYAPYDVAGDLNMYGSGNITVEQNSILNNSVTLPNICSNGSYTEKSYCYINESTKGVFIDNYLNDDKLKYSNLNLTGDFAIEMNVSKEAFNTSSTTRYIFDNYKDGDLSNSGKGLFINNYGNIIGFNGVPTICTSNCFTNNELNNDYIKIIIKNGIELNIGGKSFSLIDKNINISNLFVGSKYNGYNQINGIIDYIKIYKK